MKILFYNHTGQVSGAERLLLMILGRLDRKNFASIIVCPKSGTLANVVADLGLALETIEGLEARFTWRIDYLAHYCNSFLRVMLQLRKSVKSLKPDLIHANSIRAGLVATTATVGLGTRVVWHLHDLLPRHPLSTCIRILASLSKRSSMIAVSEAVARNFRGRLSMMMKHRVVVILNAIELEKFQPKETARPTLRSEFGLNQADFVIGIIGQLTPRKGQRELIHAFGQAQVPRASLLVVGAALFNRDSEYALALGEEAKALGISDRVLMLGPRSDVGAIMQSLDLLVVNSTSEPFGLVILEAMACGTPVLATAVDGIPEIVNHGVNGWLVPPCDRGTMAAAISHLSKVPEIRSQLAAQGKEHVTTNFSANRYMNEIENFYQTIGRTSHELDPKVRAVEITTRPADSAKFA